MNAEIKTLLENKDTIINRIKTLNAELDSIQDKLRQEYKNETNLYNEVLKHSIIDVIKFFENKNIYFDKITGGAPKTYANIIFSVTDGKSYADVYPYNGTIMMNEKAHLNYGNDSNFYTSVQEIIDTKLIPFCEKHKNEYIKEKEWI